MITYADVPLTPCADPAVRGHLAEWWHRRGIAEWRGWGHEAPDLDRLPRPARPHHPPPRPGTLCWPQGASRWATFHEFATADQIDRIRTAVGAGAAAKRLVLDDEGGGSLYADMFFLAARPVLQLGGGDYYLLTLVDERYFWWLKGDQAVPGAPVSWSGLFTSLFASVGVGSFTIPTVASGYGVPNATTWNVGYRPIPVVIDAAARAVGLRVVRHVRSGQVELMNYDGAIAADSGRWTVYGKHLLCGGRVGGADVGRSAPASVAVVFPGDTPAVSTRALSLYTSVIPELAGAAGVSGAVGQVVADLAATAAAGDRSNYADIAAKDYYAWLLGPTDAVFVGCQDWGPTGYEDRIEWVRDGSRWATHVVRPPWGHHDLYGDRDRVAAGAGAAGFFARLTTSGGGAWKWVKRVISGGAWADSGGESASFNAYPAEQNGSNTSWAEAGQRVWMIPTAGGSTYEFFPVPLDADSNTPGLVSTTTQDFKGEKTLLDNATAAKRLDVNSTQHAPGPTTPLFRVRGTNVLTDPGLAYYDTPNAGANPSFWGYYQSHVSVGPFVSDDVRGWPTPVFATTGQLCILTVAGAIVAPSTVYVAGIDSTTQEGGQVYGSVTDPSGTGFYNGAVVTQPVNGGPFSKFTVGGMGLNYGYANIGSVAIPMIEDNVAEYLTGFHTGNYTPTQSAFGVHGVLGITTIEFADGIWTMYYGGILVYRGTDHPLSAGMPPPDPAPPPPPGVPGPKPPDEGLAAFVPSQSGVIAAADGTLHRFVDGRYVGVDFGPGNGVASRRFEFTGNIAGNTAVASILEYLTRDNDYGLLDMSNVTDT